LTFVRNSCEKAISSGRINGIINLEKGEIIRFKLDEIDALVSMLASGRIFLNTLATDLKLTADQVRLVLDYLLKENKIKGVLAKDNIFIPIGTLREEVIETAQKIGSVDLNDLSGQLNVSEESVNSIIESLSKQILTSVLPYNQIRIIDVTRDVKLPENVTKILLKKLILEGKLAGYLDMVNDVLTIERAQPLKKARNENQDLQNTGAVNTGPSDAWYIVPLFFGLIGGLIGYLVVKEEDHDKADNLFVFGVFMSILYGIIAWIYWSSILSLLR
jgi:hypothetical protein